MADVSNASTITRPSAEAEKLLLESVEAARKTLARSTEELARRLNNLGGMYRRTGKHTELLAALREAHQFLMEGQSKNADLQAIVLQNTRGGNRHAFF